MYGLKFSDFSVNLSLSIDAKALFRMLKLKIKVNKNIADTNKLLPVFNLKNLKIVIS